MKHLYTIVKNELKEDEDIFILREKEIAKANGIMNKYSYDQLFNVYSGKEKVIRYWHEEGLCIVIK